MVIPEEIRRVAERAVAQHPGDTKAAKNLAIEEAEKLKNYRSLERILAKEAIEHTVDDVRHNSNRTMRNETSVEPNKVTAASAVVNDVCRSVYNFFVAGKTLGMITGNEIDGIILDESSKARGHIFTVRLMMWLRGQGVCGEKTVREVVSEKFLESSFHRLSKEVNATRVE